MLLQAIGAKSIDLEWVQVHPTGLVKPDDADAKIKFLAAEAMAKEWHLQIGNFRIWEDESEVTLPARRKGVTKKETTMLKITQDTYHYISQSLKIICTWRPCAAWVASS